MKSVVYVDGLQALVILSGAVALIGKGLVNMGGMENVWNIAKAGQRLDFAM